MSGKDVRGPTHWRVSLGRGNVHPKVTRGSDARCWLKIGGADVRCTISVGKGGVLCLVRTGRGGERCMVRRKRGGVRTVPAYLGNVW